MIQKLKNLPNKLSFDRRQAIQFIHLGKNAGTQINQMGDQINAASRKYRFQKYHHNTLLSQIDPNQKYFFSIRNPVSRFKSGFYSRKRKGQPRIYSEWTESEKQSFAQFSHANELAEALFDQSEAGQNAYCAMRSITHCAMYQHLNFGKIGHFLTLSPPVHIVRTEKFETDLAVLVKNLDLDIEIHEANDSTTAHRNDYAKTPDLSSKAISNLERWYAVDFEFYRLCESWIEQNAENTL